ncbi:histidine kinase [Fibrella sp. HMF5335]|uniref:Histidine kinase n=1 Tax=Fibrella rubiginis TaxID=2817060 RepID=A0A939GD98_9BACT|nr:histidine kinase [Fibrella rubiginis]MBO0936844.1 histidine kinase [Fibrella rubiginis]
MIRIQDSRLRWFGPICLFLFGNIFFRLSFWLTSPPRALAHSALVGLGAGMLFWQLNRWVARRIQHRFPGLERTQQRLLMVLLLAPLLVNLAIFSRYTLHILLGSRPTLWMGLVDYVTSFGIQLFYFVVYFSIYEGIYVLQQWRQTYLEKEVLIKQQWQTRFNSLKSQVNPHFLFNSLNSLSALIDESPVQASQFVDELSTMYRYLIQANDQELTQLSTELTFIESYAHLLQTRHGAGVRVSITVPDTYLSYSLPPLTLQLLVENAVKHNIVLADQPLVIDISTTDEGHLQVRNNLQRKTGQVASNGVGLTNIVAKYQMLTGTSIIVREEDNHFTVLLPLLSNPVTQSV